MAARHQDPRVRIVGMNLADSLHSPLVIHHGKMIWMRQIILLQWMMSIHQSPDLGAVMERRLEIRQAHHPINHKTLQLVLWFTC